MQTIEYNNPHFNKPSWGEGEWLNEPDKKQWADPATGLPCLIVRGYGHGAFCGYVGIPKSHPLYGVEYNEESEALRKAGEKVREGTIGKRGVLAVFCNGDKAAPDTVFDVHGSLTFSGKCREPVNECEGICHKVEPGEDDDLWWLGFDCAHADDQSPQTDATLRSLNSLFRSGEALGTYRNLAYVTAEVESLARQLKAIG